MNPSFTDIWLADYQKIAGQGAAQEFKLRMLANKHGLTFTDKEKKVRLAASAFYASDTETAVFAHFDSKLTSEEKTFLASTRQIRNKLLHCDFGEFVARLEELLPSPLPKSTVRKIKLPEDGAGIVEAILKAQAVAPSSPTVEESNENDIFGNFLICIEKGAMKEAEKLFHLSVGILDRLLEEL